MMCCIYALIHFLMNCMKGMRLLYQGVHEYNPMHCYDERYEVIATPINSNKFTDFELKKVEILT